MEMLRNLDKTPFRRTSIFVALQGLCQTSPPSHIPMALAIRMSSSQTTFALPLKPQIWCKAAPFPSTTIRRGDGLGVHCYRVDKESVSILAILLFQQNWRTHSADHRYGTLTDIVDFERLNDTKKVPGTVQPAGMPPSNWTNLNPCPLNACCDIWGQCGITNDFCVDDPADTLYVCFKVSNALV